MAWQVTLTLLEMKSHSLCLYNGMQTLMHVGEQCDAVDQKLVEVVC